MRHRQEMQIHQRQQENERDTPGRDVLSGDRALVHGSLHQRLTLQSGDKTWRLFGAVARVAFARSTIQHEAASVGLRNIFAYAPAPPP